MLSLQTSALEQQERLFRNQIRLGLREILQEELQFYQQAFGNISGSASVLAGFAFVGLQMDDYPERHKYMRFFFMVLSAGSMAICLLTAVFASFAALFSVRLALRGGDGAVEQAVVSVRGEYKLCLLMLVVGVESFIASIPFLSFYKLTDDEAIAITCSISIPVFFLVMYCYTRAEKKFFLSKADRFGSHGHAKKAKATIDSIVHDLDERNENFEQGLPGHHAQPSSQARGTGPEDIEFGPHMPPSEGGTGQHSKRPKNLYPHHPFSVASSSGAEHRKEEGSHASSSWPWTGAGAKR